MGIGAGLIGWQLTQLQISQPAQLLALIVLTAAAQIFKVEGATNRSSYNIGFVLFGFTLIELGLPSALFVMVCASLAEWLWHKYEWYIQSFNIATYAIAISAASFVYQLISAVLGAAHFTDALGILIAVATFTLLNHLMVGLVIWLARGENFVQSGIFGRLTLGIDATLIGMGAGAALLWRVNPFFAVFVVLPVSLLYITLRVPALQRQAATDAKTGLFNARHFSEALEKELARANRYDRPLTIVIADLDLLRNINNTYGHLAGDAVLIGIARILQKSVRDYDVVARFGGEEFSILMPETTPQKALARVESIRETIANTEFQIPTQAQALKVTMSFGIAGRQRPNQTANEIVHNADLAVYQAKLNGRNRTCLAESEQTTEPAEATPSSSTSWPTLETRNSAGQTPFVPRPFSKASTAASPSAPMPPSPSSSPHLPSIRPRPSWRIQAYIAAMTLLAWGLSVWLIRLEPSVDIAGLILFALIVIVMEWLAIDIYFKDTSVSTSAVPFLAGVLLFGAVGVLVLSVAFAGTAWARHRSRFSRFIFNLSNHILAGLLCVTISELSVERMQLIQPQLLQVGISIAAALVLYVGTTSLLALAVSIDKGEAFLYVWKERFHWLAPYYLALGVVAYALMFSYRTAELLGVFIILAPLGLLRFSQAQYIARTKEMVQQARATNEELLKRANEISQLNEELILALAQVIDLRDPYVLGHSQHVSRYAVLIANELGLSIERTELVRKAGLLHDIGKMGISESLLFKPTQLTPEEYAIMQQHATLGADIIATCHSLQALVPIIRHHHEHYDGSGYPQRLQGNHIPLEARIISLADTIEAMASDRPYRRAQSCATILAEIRRCSGTQFDPQIVTAFARVVQRQGEQVIANSARTVVVRDGSSPSIFIPKMSAPNSTPIRQPALSAL